MRIFDDELKEAMFDLNALAIKHDARVLAAACLSKGSYLYQQLRMLGHETPESVQAIFAEYAKHALEDGKPARVISDADTAPPSGGRAN